MLLMSHVVLDGQVADLARARQRGQALLDGGERPAGTQSAAALASSVKASARESDPGALGRGPTAPTHRPS